MPWIQGHYGVGVARRDGVDMSHTPSARLDILGVVSHQECGQPSLAKVLKYVIPEPLPSGSVQFGEGFLEQ